ncbi:phosphodiester glycosidase family protein [Pseudoduganella violaceinigra]|uniref:phosphodiester glycosidase family protein n=1 Tax=Pseudoduganella violaceinigra TaxID=246602 RepID=UPI0003FB56A6|nr:phosphodiester glycosidase family protein [Pseudoduganella violaceinigra]
MRVTAALLLPACLAACGALRAGESGYTVVTVDPSRERLQLFLRDEEGHPYKRLERVAAALGKRGQRLAFAMNAGMYHADFSPVGLFLADGVETSPLNLAPGKGNFFMRPNGVFLVTDAGALVVESSAYPALAGKARIATQSGPMLLSHGMINPLFDPDSRSLHRRNGVCALHGKAIFVISERPVNFHGFARYLRDTLQCRDALYLDGSVSSLYSAALGRNDYRADLGPIIGVVAD